MRRPKKSEGMDEVKKKNWPNRDERQQPINQPMNEDEGENEVIDNGGKKGLDRVSRGSEGGQSKTRANC